MQTTPRKEVGLALAFVGVAISIAVSVRPDRLNAPAWVAHLSAGAFILGGLIIVLRSSGRARAAEFLVCALLAVFVCIGAWISLGPGGEDCTGGFAGRPFEPSATECRVAFGIGTLMVLGMFALAVRSFLRNRPMG